MNHDLGKIPLVVDIDDGLFKTNILHEIFWSALSMSWINIFNIISFFFKKDSISFDNIYKSSNLDLSLLPVNQTIVSSIKSYKNKGHKIILITKFSESLASNIQKKIQLFDKIYSLDNLSRLNDLKKKEFINKNFDENSFILMSSSKVSYIFKIKPSKLITFNASNMILDNFAKLNLPFENLNFKKKNFYKLIDAARPYQWLKNVLVFLPMLAAQQFDKSTFVLAIFAFFAFSFVASSVYIFNDLVDLNSDRNNLQKKHRPFASGEISLFQGFITSIIFLIVGLIMSFLINHKFFIIILIYYFLTIFYSLVIKRKFLVDIILLAGFYTIRVICGGAATNTEITYWLLTFSAFIFFSLASLKRKIELSHLNLESSDKLKNRAYKYSHLPMINFMSITTGYISVLVLSFYLNSLSVTELYNYPEILWGICIVLFYWITRINIISGKKLIDYDPLIFSIKDKISQICFLIVISLITFAILI